ncbi:hypothetical protein ABOM_003286 [Aspergillus bombycis]|uniref:Uncharacterized protein n=1 Tax=Aspergillus bombycis TaxID=109264 RepID=A0A1F8A8S4_9EURO|nr:hypothetical protein ABOM_003286 [Aspergillus bombycis]OGM47829.1 hypothetical protein ABOM_003286 [Aspergillus bombycis]
MFCFRESPNYELMEPVEDDLRKIAKPGRFANREVVDLELHKNVDYSKRYIDIEGPYGRHVYLVHEPLGTSADLLVKMSPGSSAEEFTASRAPSISPRQAVANLRLESVKGGLVLPLVLGPDRFHLRL